MTKREAKAPSQRQLKVGEEVRHALAWILEREEIRDPALRGLPITVTEVRISSDLKNATAFVIALGGKSPEAMSDVLDGLNRAAPFLRRRVAERVRLKFAPKISFQADQSFDEAARIEGLLRDPVVARDLEGDGHEEDGGHGA